MTIARQPVTSIMVGASAANGMKPQTITKELVPLREEVFSSADVSSPGGVVASLHKMQRHMAEATQASRSLPVQGGTYWPNVGFVANAAHVFQHGIPGGLAVAWVAPSMRPNVANALVLCQVVETAQDAAHGKVTLTASANCVADVWFFPRPSAERK